MSDTAKLPQAAGKPLPNHWHSADPSHSLPTRKPPSTTPNKAAHTVLTSIQPLAFTRRCAGSISVMRPYLAGA